MGCCCETNNIYIHPLGKRKSNLIWGLEAFCLMFKVIQETRLGAPLEAPAALGDGEGGEVYTDRCNFYASHATHVEPSSVIGVEAVEVPWREEVHELE